MITVIQEIMSLIEIDFIGKDEYYYVFFNSILERLNKPHDQEKLAKEIRPIFGGMNTFGDLVLHKNPTTPLIDENYKLSKLKTKLYLLCKSIIEDNNCSD